MAHFCVSSNLKFCQPDFRYLFLVFPYDVWMIIYMGAVFPNIFENVWKPLIVLILFIINSLSAIGKVGLVRLINQLQVYWMFKIF